MEFYTADTHFGHENIIKYTNRPFANVEEMDRELIHRWNSVVGPKDRVWHLGDFCLGDAHQTIDYLKELNGFIHILANRWHHDGHWLRYNFTWPGYFGDWLGVFSKSNHVVTIEPPMVVLELPEYGDGKYAKALVLAHYPIARWERCHHGSWHLYGHSHGMFKNGGLSMDVGVDANDFTPVSLEKVADRFVPAGTQIERTG